MTHSRTRVAVIVALFTIALSFGLTGAASGAPLFQGATIIADPNAPDSTSTDGLCSLREAVISANKDSSSPGDCVAGSGHDTIVLVAGATYTLTKSDNGKEDSSSSGDLDITGDLTIQGNGATITVASGFRDRIFHVLSGSVTIEEVTLMGGAPREDGGAVLNLANLTITKSTLTQNAAGGSGGAIANQGALILANVTISGNRSDNHGGGLFSSAGTASINNVTVTLNLADSDNRQGGDGGGVAQAGGTLTLSNTIVGANLDASSSAHHDCSGALTSAGHNLIQNASGCSVTGNTSGNILGQEPKLRSLGDYGGPTFTHALAGNSPAIDAGDTGTCEGTDQRGNPRPKGSACDTGAYEADAPVALDDDYSTDEDSPLAVAAPGVLANDTDADGDALSSELVGGTSNGILTLNADGSFTYTPNADFNGSDSFTYVAFDGGINSNVATVTITVNPVNEPPHAADDSYSTDEDTPLIIAAPGVLANDTDGDGDPLTAHLQTDVANGTLALIGDGSFTYTPNADFNGSDSFTYTASDGITNSNVATAAITVLPVLDPIAAPTLIRVFGVAAGSSGTTEIVGLVPGFPDTTFTLDVYTSNVGCDGSIAAGEPHETIANVLTDGGGYFRATTSGILLGDFVAATVTSAGRDVSPVSPCVVAGPGNDSWPNALLLDVLGGAGNATQGIEASGQSRWYRFSVQPDSQLTITLTNLPANYDLTLYTDIQAAFEALNIDNLGDLVQLGAEVAGDAFAASSISPDAFTPDAFTPDAFTPDAFTPDAFTPDAFTPDAFTPDAFTPDAFTPDAFTPDAFTPDAFTPDAFTPDAFTPDAFTPDAFTPDAFTSAQSRSLIGISAFNGTVSEGLRVNTWNNDGDYYIRVRGRNGAYSLGADFQLNVSLSPGGCVGVNPIGPFSPAASGTGVEHLFLVDWRRMESDPDRTDLETLLSGFMTDINGLIVDVDSFSAVTSANSQADAHPTCPYAKNLVAEAILTVVDAYREVNPIQTITVLGNDDVIPFFRYPDTALLGNEINYYPPVRDNTHSQASLRLGYVLSQDAYGSDIELGLKDHSLPIASIPVGRLVETAADMITMINAYRQANGVIQPTTPSLVTGYDFLSDSANRVLDELSLGTGISSEPLITDRDVSPEVPWDGTARSSWNAGALESALTGSRHDLIFLAGHFSANSTLAADYATRYTTADLASAPPNHFKNTLVFSVGCHSGYNIVNADGIPVITREPDWAQAFSQLGATLIAGTGYQYGDTDFIEYSERLYVEFSRQLRTGVGPVSIGEALVRAKQLYLAGTPVMRGIHEKAYLEATLFGLPMLSVDLKGTRFFPSSSPSIVEQVNPYQADPGATLGLQYADVVISDSVLSLQEVQVEEPGTDPLQTHPANYFSGSNGVIANPGEPVLPAEIRDVSVDNTVLRGVGFRGATYVDSEPLIPLTSAATTEIRGVHTPFVTDIFFPARPWSVNYFGALAEADGPTFLTLSPVQVISNPSNHLKVVFRQMDDLGFRLFYSNYPDSTEANGYIAAADAPAIVSVESDVNGNVQVRVSANPAAGVQEVWVSYTGIDGSPLHGSWSSTDLIQNQSDSTLWEGQIPLGSGLAQEARFIVQAVNGVGVVSMSTNQGAYYIPGVSEGFGDPTDLQFDGAQPSSGAYSTKATFSALLRDASGAPLEGQLVSFGLGPVARLATTDSRGIAEATLPLLASPGSYQVRAAYRGDGTYAPSSAEGAFTIVKQDTTMSIAYDPAERLLTATLADIGGLPLREKAVVIVVAYADGSTSSDAVITDYAGRATIEDLTLVHGVNTLTATFGQSVFLPGGEVVAMEDSRYGSSAASTIVTINQAPVCGSVVPVPDFLWPPDGKLDTITMSLVGVDPDGDPLSIEITAVYQDEPLTRKFDAQLGPSPSTVKVRAERDGNRDGRVYHIFGVVTDSFGAFCGAASPSSGFAIAKVAIDHDASNIEFIDQGPQYNSFGE